MNFAYTFRVFIDTVMMSDMERFIVDNYWTDETYTPDFHWYTDNGFPNNWILLFVDTTDKQILDDIQHFYHMQISQADDSNIDKPSDFDKKNPTAVMQ